MTVHPSRASKNAIVRVCRLVTTTLIATAPIVGILSALSSTQAAADGPAMVLPAAGVVTLTASVPSGDGIAGDYVYVSQPTPQTPICSPCETGQSPVTVSLGDQPAGTSIVLGMDVYQYGIFGAIYKGTYYSNGSAGDEPGPGATVTQVNADQWSVAFEDVGAPPTPDVVVTVTDNVALGTAYQDALLGSSNAATNIPFACGGDPINCATGNYTETATDISVPGRGPALDLSRSYNSLNAATPSPFGNGWSDSYAMSLDDNTSAGFVTVNQENGSVATFLPNASGGYSPLASQFGTLTANADGTWTYVRRGRSMFTFSSSGQLTSESDLDGATTTLTYYASGQLATVTDQAGRTITFVYGSNGLVSSATDPAGNVTTYTYDSSGDLTGVTNPLGDTTTYGYVGGHLTTLTSPNGGVLTNNYNAAGQVTKQVDPLGRTTSFTYGTGTTIITEPNGSTTDETFAQDELTSRTQAAGTSEASTTSYAYDPNTLSLLSVTDPNGKITTYTYDANGNRTSVTSPLGEESQVTFNAFDEPLSTTTPMGTTTTDIYDARGNELSVSTPLSSSVNQTTTFTYGDSAHPGDVTAMTDPNGKTTFYAYDTDGDLVKTTDPLGNVATATFNVLGQKTSSTSPNGNVSGANPAGFTTNDTYDALGHLLTTTDPLGDVTTDTYDGDGNLASTTDPTGQKTTYLYDLDNELTKTTSPNGSSTSAAYGAEGNVVSQTNADGQTTTYNFNPLNERVSSTDALGNVTTYGYDLAGNQATVTNPSDQTTTDTYNTDNELTGVSYSDGATPAVSYTYNPDGQRTSMTDATGTTDYSYDPLGRLTSNSVTSGATETISYAYDLDNNVISLTYPAGGVVTEAYNAADQMTSETDWLAHTTSYGYDADANLTTITHPDSSVDTYSYNADDAVTNAAASGPDGAIFSLATPRNANGDVTSQSAAVSGSTSITTGYNYDANQRLTGTTVGTGSLATPAAGFSYDAADNLTSNSVAGQGVRTNTYNADDQLTSSANPTIGLTGISTALTYNEEGQRTNETTSLGSAKLSTNFSWNQAGELTGYAGPAITAVNGVLGSNVTLANEYNGDGLLTLTTDTTQELYYDLAQGSPQIISNGLQDWVRGPGGLVVEEAAVGASLVVDGAAVGASLVGDGAAVGAEPLYYHHDQLGSTRALTNQSGDDLVNYTYTPYGLSSASRTGVVNPFGFTDSYTDQLSGLIYLTNRWYDPATGQFLSLDPLVGETGQPYSYAGDDPVNETDPLGLWPCLSWSCITNDAAQTWDATGGQVVSAVDQHWRGITQVLVTAAAGVATGFCIDATAGACAVMAPEIGCGVGALNAWIGGAGAGNVSAGCASGGFLGSIGLLCVAGLCGPALAALAVDLAAGGVQGTIDYARSDPCSSVLGYAKAFVGGAANNAPIPWEKLFNGGE